MPSIEGKSGSHFFAKYRIKGETTWLSTENVLEDDFVIIRGLQPDENYEFVVASVDGEYLKESQIQDVQTVGLGELLFLSALKSFHENLELIVSIVFLYL